MHLLRNITHTRGNLHLLNTVFIFHCCIAHRHKFRYPFHISQKSTQAWHSLPHSLRLDSSVSSLGSHLLKVNPLAGSPRFLAGFNSCGFEGPLLHTSSCFALLTSATRLGKLCLKGSHHKICCPQITFCCVTNYGLYSQVPPTLKAAGYHTRSSGVLNKILANTLTRAISPYMLFIKPNLSLWAKSIIGRQLFSIIMTDLKEYLMLLKLF